MRACMVAGVFLLLATGCKSKFEKILGSNDPDYMYRQATYYYNLAKEKGTPRYYENARLLLEDLRAAYTGTSKIEDVYYYLAYCYFGLGDLEQARFYFKSFTETFQDSEHTEDCYYMMAFCYYKDSPIYSLDQSSTLKAIEQFQLYLDLYPASVKVDECNRFIDELRAKLERKSYENAQLFYTIGYYPAAIISLKNSLRQFPDTDFREDIEFLILKSNYLYAKNSIRSRKEERYNDTMMAYQSFVEQFPESKYTKEVQEIEEESKEALAELTPVTAQVPSSETTSK
ncbi:MAG TPA: outer membrane protein assembly factor BamD [Anseongella sp.]